MAEQHPLTSKDLTKSLASFGVAAAVKVGTGYSHELIKSNASKPKPKLVKTARNGDFRKASASPNAHITKYIHQNFPNVSPNHLTGLGLALVVGSDIAAYVKPKWSIAIAAVPYTIGGLVDGLDGNLARLKEIVNAKGMKWDVTADKLQEVATAAVNSLMASREGNRVAALQYAGAAATATLPAFYRAEAETKGHIVSEDAIGSRVMRGIFGGVGLGLHNVPAIADTNSALMTFGNSVTAFQRRSVAKNGKDSPYYRGHNNDSEFRELAVIRRDALVPIVGLGIATGGVLVAMDYVRNRRANEEAVHITEDQQISITIEDSDFRYRVEG